MLHDGPQRKRGKECQGSDDDNDTYQQGSESKPVDPGSCPALWVASFFLAMCPASARTG